MVSLLKKILNGNGRSTDLLLPAEQFRTLIIHECARCDRSSNRFSLIHVDLRSLGKEGGRRVRDLTRAAVRRMRTTDEIGWLDDNGIGIFLPETGREGARRLAKEACEGFSYQIYTYPHLPGIRASGKVTGPGQRRDEVGHQPSLRTSTTDPVSEEHHPVGRIEELIMPQRLPSWKRFYDIIVSLFAITFLAPLFGAVAVFIKVVSPGPVFFRQERVGYLGRSFTMWKFRTMKTGTDNVSAHRSYLKSLISSGEESMTKLDSGKGGGRDKRLIPLAGILRRSCIDELPQFFNVLMGHMSLVGPRPCLAYEAEEYHLWHNKRFHTVPGMTGLWQVSGKNRLTFKEMMRLDIRYSQNLTPVMDLMITVKTIPAIMGQVSDAVRYKIRHRRKDASPVKEGSIWGRTLSNLSALVRQTFL